MKRCERSATESHVRSRKISISSRDNAKERKKSCTEERLFRTDSPYQEGPQGAGRKTKFLLAPWHWRKPWEAKGSQGPLHESNVCALRGVGDAAPHLLLLEDAENSPR